MKRIATLSLLIIGLGTFNGIRAQEFRGFSPRYDSIVTHYLQTSDVIKLVDTYVEIANDTAIFLSPEDRDSLLTYSAKVYESANKYDKAFRCYNIISVYNLNQGNNFQALRYASKARKLAEDAHNNIDIAIIESNIATIYTKIGDYEQANEFNFRALKIFTELGEELHIARCNLGIGSIYYLVQDYKKALHYFMEADDYFVKLMDNRGHSICLTNIGSVLNETGKYEQALTYFFDAVSMCKIDNDLDGEASNYSNIGSIYYNQKKYYEAENIYNRSIDICDKLNNLSLLSSNYLQLSKIFSKYNQFDKSYDYCLRCLNLTRQTNEKRIRKLALDQLSDICYRNGRYKEAYNFFQEASLINDSLLIVEKSARISLLEEKFINERLEKDNLNLSLTNELQTVKIQNQRHNIIKFAVISFILLLLLIIIGILYKKKNSAYKCIVRKNLEVIDTERKIRDLNDSMNNPDNKEIKTNVPTEEQKRIISFLETDFKNNKIYTDNDLSIEKLAKYCSTNRTYLSKIINDIYRMNYIDFINGYRINEAILLLSDPKISQAYTIEAIANESGYANISSFNASFKKITGLTPSVFRKNVTIDRSCK